MGSIAGMVSDMLRKTKGSNALEPLAIECTVLYLDKIIARRQQLVSEDSIESVVGLLHDFGLQDEPSTKDRVEFLACVGSYHEHMNRKKRGGSDPTEKDWGLLGQRFLDVVAFSAVPKFYSPNYGLLCFKRAKDPSKVRECYDLALKASGDLPLPENAEAEGHLHYNWSKYLLETGRRNEALEPWQKSTGRRIVFYELLLNADHGRLLAAAQQIVKMRYDFREEGFFPETDTDLCMVSQDYYDGLVGAYGDEVFKSCVTKPKAP